MDHKNDSEKYPNDIFKEDASPRSSYDEDLTLTQSKFEKVLSATTEKYDIEKGHHHMAHIEPIKSTVTIASVVELPDPTNTFYDDIPNGGYGWVVAASGFLINFIMFGAASIWGVFSNAFATTIMKDKVTTTELMGVGATLVVCINIFTPMSPLLARLGTRLTMVLGSILLSLGMILTGFATEIWHVYLTQGVLVGLGSSILYMSIVGVIPQWFTTLRATAMGISSSGGGFGGLALSPMVSSLVQKYGLPWTYRIIGLMALSICLLASCMMRTRLPPGHDKKQPIRSPIKLSMLKDIDFVIWLIGVVISLTGYLIPLFYIPKYCSSYGISQADSANIVGVACAMNAIGRLILGYFADRIGRLNMYVIASTVAGLTCMLFWPFAKTYGTMMGFAVIFGFVCGIYYALAAPITSAIVGTENISSGLSILFILSSISGVGPTMASAIQQATSNQGYIGVKMFSGSLYLFGSIVCILLKVKMTGSFLSNM